MNPRDLYYGWLGFESWEFKKMPSTGRENTSNATDVRWTCEHV